MDNPTIVVSLSPEYHPASSPFATIEALAEKPIRVKGAGFKPKDQIKVTICEKDLLIGEAVANSCGAFQIHKPLPPVGFGVFSVKAWVGKDCKAYWPLDVIKEWKIPPK
jgi:hypothetical protein